MTAVKVWRGIRYADLSHPFDVGSPTRLSALPEEGGEFGSAPLQPLSEAFSLGATVDSDCLFLNVYAPTDSHRLPILVWVYGGGFERGAGSSPHFDGSALAARAGCVVIVPNYRVGTYGFAALHHHGSRLASSHNLGLRDVQTALNWTAAHGEMFGGDPKQITLAGHSSGGFLSAAAAAAPGTARIRALACFSGGASRISSKESARELGDAIVSAAGRAFCPDRLVDTNPDSVLLAQERVSPSSLAVRNGQDPRGLGLFDDSSLEAALVSRHPMSVISDGALVDVAILSAATIDEVESFPPSMTAAPDKEAFLEAAVQFCGSEVVARSYHVRYGSLDIAWKRLLTDYIYRLPAARLAHQQREAGGQATFLDISRDAGQPAGHGTEVAALFGQAGTLRDQSIAHIFDALIRTGKLPSYPVVTVGDEYVGAALNEAELLEVWTGVSRP